MTPKDLKARTERFADAIVRFCTPLLEDYAVRDVARQLLRCGTAVNANYGSAQRARSHDEFTARIGTVFDEAAESSDWLKRLTANGLAPKSGTLTFLVKESEELTRIFASSYATARTRRAELRRKPSRPPNKPDR